MNDQEKELDEFERGRQFERDRRAQYDRNRKEMNPEGWDYWKWMGPFFFIVVLCIWLLWNWWLPTIIITIGALFVIVFFVVITQWWNEDSRKNYSPEETERQRLEKIEQEQQRVAEVKRLGELTPKAFRRESERYQAEIKHPRRTVEISPDSTEVTQYRYRIEREMVDARTQKWEENQQEELKLAEEERKRDAEVIRVAGLTPEQAATEAFRRESERNQAVMKKRRLAEEERLRRETN